MTPSCPAVGALVMQVQDGFLETPRLHLTAAQAAHRFGIDPASCEAVLDALVESGVLTRSADGAYVRFFPHLAHAA